MSLLRPPSRHLAILVSSLVAFGDLSGQSVSLPQGKGAWEKVACPFDSTRALLPVTCGRLSVPENHAAPGRSIEIAFMVVKPRNNSGQVPLADPPPKSVDGYRRCALTLARQFLADPEGALDSRCAETRRLRLVP